jgi:hypothetical protein
MLQNYNIQIGADKQELTVTAPDPIASLPDQAAELATAATAKLGEALAIAERDATFNADRQWFKRGRTAAFGPGSPRRR